MSVCQDFANHSTHYVQKSPFKSKSDIFERVNSWEKMVSTPFRGIWQKKLLVTSDFNNERNLRFF